jgi:hypothetical protein
MVVDLLEGNPRPEGPFKMRLRLPDAFKIPPHWHPAVEHVTVISGTFNLGMGHKFEASSGRALTAGSFAFMPPGMRHFAWPSFVFWKVATLELSKSCLLHLSNTYRKDSGHHTHINPLE